MKSRSGLTVVAVLLSLSLVLSACAQPATAVPNNGATKAVMLSRVL